MKKNNYIILCFCSLIFFTGCNNDFMDRFPSDSINDENFWKSENDMAIYCNGLYTFIGGHASGNTVSNLLSGDNQSDNLVPATYNVIAAGQHTVPAIAKDTKWDWTFVRKCNYFLTRYDRADINQPVKDAYAGEVRFFKAWRYFQLVKSFGDVPWLQTDLNVDSPELYAARDPRALVMDSVLMTIDRAIANLPTKANAVYGRINRDMALMLKARICLHEGTFRKYHSIEGSEKFLQEAVNTSSILMNEKGYKIHNTGHPESDYRSLFCTLDLTTNEEMILVKVYATGLLGNRTSNHLEGTESNLGYSVSKSLVDAYLCKCGKPISLCKEHFPGHNHIKDEMLNRDPRLTQTVCYPGQDLQRNTGMPAIPASGLSVNIVPTGYQIIKYWVDDPEEYLRYQQGILDAPVMRYGEVLLIHAEAMAELGQCTQEVLNKTINLLRQRAGMPDMVISELVKDPASDFPDLPVLLDEIRRERRVELAIEALRYDDLMRWKAGSLMTKVVRGMKFHQEDYPKVELNTHVFIDSDGFILPYAKTLPGGRVFEENKHYYFPLPTEELILNPKLEQNPNW